MISARSRLCMRVLTICVGAGLSAWALADDNLVGGGPGFGFTQAAILAVGLLVAGGAWMPPTVNARMLAVVLSTGLVLAAAEVGVRALVGPRFATEHRYDPHTLYGPAPGTVIEHRRMAINGGDRIVYRINSQGFRGDELAQSPAARIVVYGDSFTHAYYSADENTFVQRLGREVAARLGVPVEAVNAGVAGYGPDQALVKMERELERLQPDLVLVAIFSGNDFGDLVRNKMFRIGASGELRENPFSLAPDVMRAMETHRSEAVLKKLLRNAVHGLLVDFGWCTEPADELAHLSPRQRIGSFRATHLKDYEEFVLEGDNVVRNLTFDPYDADVSLDPDCAAARFKIALMDKVLGRMQETLARHAVPFLMIPIPHPLDLGPHGTGEIDVAEHPDYRPRCLVGILESIAARRDIATVDLYSAFAARGSEALYFRGFDDHWSDAGQAFAADLVADRLAELGLLDRLARAARSRRENQ